MEKKKRVKIIKTPPEDRVCLCSRGEKGSRRSKEEVKRRRKRRRTCFSF